MNPYELLKKDHEVVSVLFDQIEAASGQEKVVGFKKLLEELELHTGIEETIFYPALKNTKKARDITLEAYEEHKVVKDLLEELSKVTKPDDKWTAKFTVLRENVEHHVDEEEGDLFKKAKDVLSTEEAEALGDQMAAEKEKQGSPVSEELKKPSLLQRVGAFFGSGEEKKNGTKKKTSVKARRAAKKTETRSAASAKTSRKAASASPRKSAKKSAKKSGKASKKSKK